MSINYISNPVYVLSEINTFNYIYSNTLNYRYKRYQSVTTSNKKKSICGY